MAVHDDRLHAELDRQLAEVRAACDGLATRSGLLAAIAVVTGVFAPRIDTHRHEILLVLTAVALGIATVAAIVTLMPWLKIGPLTMWLTAWMSAGPKPATSSQLYDSKTVILAANMNRLLAMKIFFSAQAIATGCAIGLALSYTALR